MVESGKSQTLFLKQSCKTLIIIACTFLLFFLNCNLHANPSKQEPLLTIKLNNASLAEIFEFIEKHSDYHFVYINNDIDEKGRINIAMKNSNIRNILAYCLNGLELDYEIDNKKIFW